MPSRAPDPVPARQAPAGVPGPALSYTGYGQAMQPPGGVESAGGFRSEAPSPTTAVRQEASPPSSPPAGGVSYTSPAPHYQTQTQTQTHPQAAAGPEYREHANHGTGPMVQQTQPAAAAMNIASPTG